MFLHTQPHTQVRKWDNKDSQTHSHPDASLSEPLVAALVGKQEMTQALMSEWQTKRPQDYREHKIAAIKRALADIGNPGKAAILRTDKLLCYAKYSEQ